MKNKSILFGIIGVFVFSFASFVLPVNAQVIGDLPNRSLRLTDSKISVVTTYTLGFSTPSNYTLGSVALEFCDEDPLPNEPCTTPSNMSAVAVTLGTQLGTTGFTVHPNTSINRVVLSRPPALQTAGAMSFQLNNITNPDTARTYYARIYIYSSNDGTGAELNNAGIAYAINKALVINSEVPPNLLFCVAQTIPAYDCLNATGSFLDFGELSKTSVKSIQHQMLAATNAGFGFNVTVTGTTLTSGNNIIAALASPTPSNPGTAQFGFNLRANSNPSGGQDPVGPGVGGVVSANYNIPNQYTFNSGDIIFSTPGPIDYFKTTATYIVNVPNGQKPGVYNTTILYICLANF